MTCSSIKNEKKEAIWELLFLIYAIPLQSKNVDVQTTFMSNQMLLRLINKQIPDLRI